MNKYPCKLIEDLLPLYIEDDVSDETKAIIEKHLEECDNCRKLVQEYSNDDFDLTIEDFKEDLPKAKTYKKSMKKLKKWSLISVVSLIFIAITIGAIGYNIGKPEDGLLTQRTIVRTLERNGVELKKDKSKEAEEYELNGTKPAIFDLANLDNVERTLLLYTFESIDERQKVEELYFNKFQYIQSAPYEISYKAKNSLIVIIGDEDITTEDEYTNLIETVNLISDTVFEDLNHGKIMVFKGESENWEGTYTVKYYEHWWNDESGTLKREGYFDNRPQLHYKSSDIAAVGLITIEYQAGLASGNETGIQLDYDGNIPMGYLRRNSAGVTEKDDIIFTIKWDGKEEEVIMKVEK